MDQKRIIETVNLYSAFIWLAILQLAEKGEIAAITPRSFCNGTYFRPFRQAFLLEMKLQKIDAFESIKIALTEEIGVETGIINE